LRRAAHKRQGKAGAARRGARSRVFARAAAGRGLLRGVALLLAALLVPLVLPSLVPPPARAQSSGGGTMELIPANSLVIPMDNVQQVTAGNLFNLKAYGVVERLLWAGVPVKWVIQPGKAKDGLDFTANASRLYPSAQGAASRNFSGGPFVVHRDYAVAAKNAIGTYAASNNVTVYETTADVTAPVRHTLTHRPKVAVFDDGMSAAIHVNYLLAAGFVSGTHYDIIPAATLVTVNADACFTIGTEPHWEGGTNTDPQVSAIRQFVTAGGNFLAECHGILVYENNTTYGRFLSTTGVTSGNGDNPISFPNPDLPYSQFNGPMADVGGSVRDFAPVTNGAWLAGEETHVQRSGSLRNSYGGPPAKAAAGRVSGPSAGGWVFYLGGHEYTTADQANINAVRMYLNAVFTPSSRPSSCGLTLTPRTIAGTVYEDVNGDSQLGDGVGRPGVQARLYQDANNSGAVDAGDTFLAETTTDASGAYSFQVAPQSTGNNYLVAVNSKAVTPSAGLISGRGDAWAEQTYGDDPSTAAFDPGSRFGGRQAGTSDNFNTANNAVASNAYQHLARVSVASADVTNAHFGFSFNVVTNTRAGDTVDDDTTSAGRTVQGSLRQFVQNANSVTGANYMRFVPGVAANAGGATYWQVAVTTAMAAVIDPDTTFDGTAYNSANGTAVRDTNTGSLGAGGAVGVGNLALAQVARPELEILGTSTVAVGLDLQANNSTVRRLALRGFGTTPNSDTSANVRLGNNFTNALIEQNFIGPAANAANFNAGAATSAGDNVRSAGADSGTLRNNLIGYSNGKGVQLGGGSTGWLVEGNEVRSNGVNNSNLDGLDIESSGNNTVRGNLFAGNEAAGVDTSQSSGGNTIENNTVTGNGVGAGANIVSAGVRVYGTGNTISLNVVSANFGAGVMVTSGASANLVTRNSIFANGTITNKGGAGPSNQIGIDLLSAANSQTTGTAPYVTANDAGDADGGGNGLLNFPVFTAARVVGGDLVLQGYAAPGAALELFIAAPDPSGFGEGQTYLTTLVEGSAADQNSTTGTYASPLNGQNVGTDTTNLFQFTIPLPAGVAVGTVLTATATSGGATSEFSNAVTVAPPPPSVVLCKTFPGQTCDPPPSLPPQMPGAEITYVINFTNTGGSAAHNIVLTDPLPTNTDLKVGSVQTNLGTTGLAVAVYYSYDNAVNFVATPPTSGGGGAPAGYDRSVTHVRWVFTGDLSSAAPNNAGSVQFVARIQ